MKLISYIKVRVRLKVHHPDNVLDQIRLYLVVYIIIEGHSRTGINFKQPWFHIIVNDYIETKKFKTAI